MLNDSVIEDENYLDENIDSISNSAVSKKIKKIPNFSKLIIIMI